MKLRIRLILAFLLLSVLPLGAVTVYSYMTNRQALEAAATRETDELATELSGRMTLVTAQLGQSLERLMEIPATTSSVRQTIVKTTSPVAPASPSSTTAAVTPETAVIDTQVADTLGSAAMLLNTVEVPRPRPPDDASGPRRGGPPGGRPRLAPEPHTDDLVPVVHTDEVAREFSGTGFRGRRPFRDDDHEMPPTERGGPRPSDPDGAAVPGNGPLVGPSPDAPGAPDAESVDRIRIDLGHIRREMFRQIVPGGTNPLDMTPEQRQRLSADINQRLLGIGHGIKLAAAELERKADEARRKAEADAKAQAVAAPVRHTALQGTQLDVTMEQDGKVVRAAKAEINLPTMLTTVFSSMPKSRGEIPFAIANDGRLYTTDEPSRALVEQLTPGYRPNGASAASDWIVVMTAGPAGSNLRLGIARPVGDSLSELRRTAGRNAGLGLLCIGFAVVAIVPLSGRLTRNLSTLADGVKRITDGDYAARISVRSKDEMGELAAAFNRMAAEVEVHQQTVVGQERLKRELELGRQIQHDMLPRAPLRLGATEVHGVSNPAREVGGDFFHYAPLSDRSIALLIGDVSGKGVGAALLMANIQAALRTRLLVGQDLAAIADAIDRDLEANSPGQMYATLFLAVLDLERGRLRYVNAGHLPQFVVREDGTLHHLPATGLPIGLLAGHGYVEREVNVTAGDRLFFYTDGCIETENEHEDMYGVERLEDLLRSCRAHNLPSALAEVSRALHAFRGTREPFDDATLMAVDVR